MGFEPTVLSHVKSSAPVLPDNLPFNSYIWIESYAWRLVLAGGARLLNRWRSVFGSPSSGYPISQGLRFSAVWHVFDRCFLAVSRVR
jgi:hypothetical protein